MTKNMGKVDRVMRFVAAIVVGFLYYYDKIDGIFAYFLMAVAILFIVTSFIGFCPMYVPMDMNTIDKEENM